MSQSTEITKTAKGGAVGIIGVLLSSGLRLAVAAVLTRLLGDESYGHYIIAFSIVMTLTRLADMGMIQAILRWGSILVDRQQSQKLYELLKFSFLLAAGGLIVIGGGFALAAEYIAEWFTYRITADEIRLFLLALPLIVTAEILASVARAHKGVMVFYSVKGIIPASALLMLIAGLAIWTPTLPLVTICFILSYAVAVIYGFYYLKKKKIISKEHSQNSTGSFGEGEFSKGEYVKFGIASAMIAVLEILRDRVPVFLIGKMITASEAGMFFNAGRPAVLMIGILSGLNAILSPKVAVLHNAGKIDELNSIYRSIVRWAILVTFPTALFMLLEPEWVMDVLFNMQAQIAGQMLFWLALFKLASLLIGTPRLILQMSGHPTIEIWISSILVALMVPVLYWSLPQWGSIGGIIATGVIMLFSDLVRGFFAWKIVGVSPMGKREILVLTGNFALAIAASYYIGLSGYSNVWLSILVTIILSLLAVFTLSTDDDKQLLNTIKAKFTGRSK